MEIDLALVRRFAALFAGNNRSFGQYMPNAESGRRMRTLKRAPTTDDFLGHLTGEMGVGIVPIADDNNAAWGAIDIDAHGDAEAIDIVALEENVRALDLPLMVCRSKSGGAHLYLFCTEPISAKLVKVVLSEWASRLKFPGAEIFPKQERLHGLGNDKQLGNWINLCYFDAMDPNQLRYCIEGGKAISLEYFVEVAESRRVSGAVLIEKREGDHSEAPPCILRLLSDGVNSGMRNEALYNIAIYMKKAFPETWRDRVAECNAKSISPPLTFSEVNKLISSIGARTYRYKCKEEPIRPLCNSSVCVDRKHGITKEEKCALIMGEQPKYGPIKKYETSPVRWGLFINDVEVNLTTTELMTHKSIREAAAERLTIIIPPMKNDRWLAELQTVMDAATVIEAPDEASPTGLVWQHLMSFLRKGKLERREATMQERSALLRGMPVVIGTDDGPAVFFRGVDFVSYLRKSRAEDLKGINLWFALRDQGVGYKKIRVGVQVVQSWYILLDRVLDYPLDDVCVEPEF